MSGGPRFGRRHALGLGALGAAAGAVAISRRTTPAAVESAAGAPARTVQVATDLPHLSSGGAPSIEGGSGWMNTAALSDSQLASRVVLYEFWTFGCINCRNVLPHTKAWHDRYAPDGLVLLAIHTPEFDRERDPDAVAAFLAERSIEYPVLLDPDKVVWRRWSNRYWPAFYLYDADGDLRRRHVGEGRYDEMETAIRVLLGVAPGSPRASVAT